MQFQSPGAAESHSSTISFHEKADEPRIKRYTSVVALHYWCYALHAILFILQVILLAMLWNHPERSITIAFDNSVLTIGLSAFLQAFYTLYTALLVFLTQRLALTGFLSRPQKLTAIHDVSSAWAGLGAATSSLWQQTNIAASTGTSLLIFVYLLCVSVLHVASPTIIEFEPYTPFTTVDILAQSTWPGVNLSSFDMSTEISLLPFMSILTGLSTDGLSNSTLYDKFNETSNMINASVNAYTVHANCGLLQNLSYTIDGEFMNVTASTDGLSQPQWWSLNTTDLASSELVFIDQFRSDALLYVTSIPIQINGSVGNNSFEIVLNLTADGSNHYNVSTTVYTIACSLGVSNYTSNLEVQSGNLAPTVNQPDAPTQAWSPWTPYENALGSQLNWMMSSAFDDIGGCFNVCYSANTLDDHLMMLLGIGEPNSASSNTTSITPTPYQFEKALSQITAEVIWIAGQLGEDDEGFELAESFARVLEWQAPRWRLNINAIPVVFTLVTSFILSVMAFRMLGVPPNIRKNPPSVKGTTVLEMFWVGAHFGTLRKQLSAISHPSPKELRSAGMFQVWLTKSELVQRSGTVSEEMSSLIPEAGADAEFEDIAHAQTRTSKNLPGVCWSSSALSFIKSRYFWCYLLHGLFFLLHSVLLLLLIRHPEHRVVIQSDSEVSTTALAASLQFFYVVYTLILVFLTQLLVVSRAVAHTQNMTSIHDLSQAWTGIGSALAGVWEQAKVTASLRTTVAIAVYYFCVSILHIASTTVIQFEVFNGNSNHVAQSALGWPASGLGTYDWTALSPIVPLDQLPIFPTKGLANSMVYDVPTADLASVNATVNATTIHANCGLLPTTYTDSLGIFNTTVPSSGPVVISLPEVWKDTVLFLDTTMLHTGSNTTLPCSTCGNYLIYWVTTALQVDESLGEEVSVNTTWLYTPSGQNQTSSNTVGYLVGCSLNATTTADVLDVQRNLLTSTTAAQSADSSQPSWSLWLPTGDTPSLGNEISTALSYANPFISNTSEYIIFGGSFTIMDMYTMSLFGINLTENTAASLTQSSANPSVTLSLSQFENAISQIAAQYIWAAGHTDGDFGPTFGSGESVVTDVAVLRRLNVNTIPVVIASTASLALFVLAVYMVGFGPSTPLPLSELGVLETLWLEAHSDVLHARMCQIADPTLHNLRVAGMFEVCLANEVRGALGERPDETLELLNGADSESSSFGA